MSFSVVIPTFNQEEALRAQLPLLLQEEVLDDVVVVNMDSEDNTKSVLEGLELVFPNLKHTYTPHSSRHQNLLNLAIMLGCRSAAHENILLTMVDETGRNPLLSMTPAQIQTIFATMKKRKRKNHLLLRPRAYWSLKTLWHRLFGFNYFFKYITSKRSNRDFRDFQILVIK